MRTIDSYVYPKRVRWIHNSVLPYLALFGTVFKIYKRAKFVIRTDDFIKPMIRT